MQLFEKLKLQENPGDDEPAKKHKEAQETASKHQPANPKSTPKTPSAHPASKTGDSRTESKLSDAVKIKPEKHKVSLKARQGPEVRQKKDSQTYGKVHTRHINQLFIRGESVLLVNPQPLSSV